MAARRRAAEGLGRPELPVPEAQEDRAQLVEQLRALRQPQVAQRVQELHRARALAVRAAQVARRPAQVLAQALVRVHPGQEPAPTAAAVRRQVLTMHPKVQALRGMPPGASPTRARMRRNSTS